MLYENRSSAAAAFNWKKITFEQLSVFQHLLRMEMQYLAGCTVEWEPDGRARPAANQMRRNGLKQRLANLRTVCRLSVHPSPKEGPKVNRNLFYVLTACSMHHDIPVLGSPPTLHPIRPVAFTHSVAFTHPVSPSPENPRLVSATMISC